MGKTAITKPPLSITAILAQVFLMLFPVIQVSGLYDGTFLPRFIYVQIGALILLVLLSYQLFKAKGKWVLTLPLLAYIGFYLAHWLSASNAINTTEATFGIIKTGGILLWTLTLAQGLVSGFITVKHLLRGVTTFAGISALWAGGQLLSTLAGGNFWEAIYDVYQPFGHKNLLSSALMLTLPFLMGHAAIADKTWSTVARIILVLVLVEIFVLRTRAAWLGTLGGGATLLLILMLQKNSSNLLSIKRISIALGAGVLLLVGVVSLSGARESITNPGNLENRFWFWENSVAMIQEHPMGVGPGNWRAWFPKYGLEKADNNVQNGITTINRPHNDYLWVASELGIFGVACFFILFITLFIDFHRIRTKVSDEDAKVVLPIALGLVAYMLFSITDFPLERAAHQVLLGLLIAFIVFYSHQTNRAWVTVKVPALVVGIPGVALLLWGLPFSLERLSSSKAYMDVYQANERRDPNRIVQAVQSALSDAFNVDFYGNPLPYFSGLGNNALQKYPEAERDFLAALELHPYHIISLNH
ncbi:MAG: O-antigen ligase family protein, partial [Schleiferiaceae bacterium]|nr:O-antigen ligase family protein [Schleiferiaceae bacterium]